MRLAITFMVLGVGLRADTLKEILDRMDVDSAAFKGLTAKVKRIEFNAPPLNETSEMEGEMTLYKGKKGISALVDFLATKDPKQFLFRDGQLYEYLPKLTLVNEYDLGKSTSIINQFVTLGFGSSGKELQKSYTVVLRGTETLKIADKEFKVSKLELTPKSGEALKMIRKIEFWIPEGKSYALKLKMYEPSGNTDTAIYSNLQINPATLNEHSVELKAPKNAKHEKINK